MVVSLVISQSAEAHDLTSKYTSSDWSKRAKHMDSQRQKHDYVSKSALCTLIVETSSIDMLVTCTGEFRPSNNIISTRYHARRSGFALKLHRGVLTARSSRNMAGKSRTEHV